MDKESIIISPSDVGMESLGSDDLDRRWSENFIRDAKLNAEANGAPLTVHDSADQYEGVTRESVLAYYSELSLQTAKRRCV